MDGKDLARRTAVAAVGIPVALALIARGGWAVGGLAAAVAAVGVAEFYRLALRKGQRPFSALGVAGTLTVVLWATARPSAWAAAPGAALVLLVVVFVSLGASVWLRWPGGSPMADVTVTAVGVVYVGFALAFVPILRAVPDAAPDAFGSPLKESAFVLLPLVATWVGDSAAYLAGLTWGRARLAPAASPKKTRVGAVAGLAGSAAAAAGVAWWALASAPALTVTVGAGLGVGLVLGAVGQIGDLAESVLKREAGVKDSGGMLPGHGGVLDRVDALLFAFPAAWLLLLALGIVAPTAP